MMLKRHILATLAIALWMVAISGCAGQPEKQPSSIDKWRELAEKSQGYSPTARHRKIDLPPKKIETIASGPATQTPSRPLPERKITMKMHQTDVAVLLRALARAVNQNIMINESVGNSTATSALT